MGKRQGETQGKGYGKGTKGGKGTGMFYGKGYRVIDYPTDRDFTITHVETYERGKLVSITTEKKFKNRSVV